MSAVKTVTVTLGEEQESLEHHLASGHYASADEVVREALRALDREAAHDNVRLKAMVDEALADPRPPIPMKEVFDRLKKRFPLDGEGQ